jgi:hypothetical protein
MRLARLRATEIAVRVGTFVALVGMGLLFWWVQNPLLFAIVAFVLFAGQQELAAVRRKEFLRNAEPIDVLPADPPVSAPMNVTEPGFTGFAWDSQYHTWVLWRNGRPVATYGTGSE